MYETADDMWHMNNVYADANSDSVASLHDELHQWYSCEGDTCL